MTRRSVMTVWVLLGSSLGVLGFVQVYLSSENLSYSAVALALGIFLGLVGGIIRLLTLQSQGPVEMGRVEPNRLRLVAAVAFVTVFGMAASVAWARGARPLVYGTLALFAGLAAVASAVLRR